MQANTAAEEYPPVRPLVIPVFIPNAGCPHRCIFCNQSAVTGRASRLPTAGMLRADIDRFLSHRVQLRHPVQIALYGGNFLGLETAAIQELLAAASRYVDNGLADGLRFSTRPETITPERIDLLRGYPVTTVEIGAQTMSATVLRSSKRGHCAADTIQALTLLKDAGYQTGIQLMVGLPEETREDVATTARAVAALKPDLARIYPTLVLAGSPLAGWYRQGRFTPIDLDEALWRAKTLYSRFYRAGIRVIRMGLQASEDLSQPSTVLAGPYHPAFGQLVLSALFLDAMTTAIDAEGLRAATLELRVNPRSESKLRGLKNHNLKCLKNRYRPAALTVVADRLVAEQQVWINGLSIDVMATDNWLDRDIATI